MSRKTSLVHAKDLKIGSNISDGLLGDYRFIRNPDKESSTTCIYRGEKPTYEGNYKAVPVKKGNEIHCVCKINQNETFFGGEQIKFQKWMASLNYCR